MREVRCTQSARVMHLAEEHFLGRAFGRPPTFYTPLKTPQQRVVEFAWVLGLQPLEERIGHQARSVFELLLDLRPDRRELVAAGPPIPLRHDLAGKSLTTPLLPSRLFVHVRFIRRLGQSLTRNQRPPKPFFNVATRDYFAKTKGMRMEGCGHTLLLYRWGVRIKPNDVREFLEDGWRLLSLFHSET
jgi:hypothetical protein